MNEPTTMEQEQWPADYQQSARLNLERTAGGKSTRKLSAAENEEMEKSQIKEDPDAKIVFPQVKNEYGPGGTLISEKSRQTIQLILAQIKALSQNDKYLLYLKLPSEITDIIDPFRQSLNPLGSRSEICRTIVWIRTHLEEDQNISLPKKEVYNEYEQYCEKNNIKPLSQADFGKVMKQVFPKVRARRLGQRGNSKYCYSGLRRRVSLEPPLLPDLIDKPLSTEAPLTQSSITAAWLVVKDWAQQQLGVQFTSLQSLAHYLIRNCFVGSGLETSGKLPLNTEIQCKGDEAASKGINKQHRELQLQLQKKIQQRTEGKERKRKVQSTKEAKPGAKKCRSHSVPASSITSALSQEPSLCVGGPSNGECSTASSSCGSNSVSPTQGRTICDKPEFTQLTALPDFKSFQKPALADGGHGTAGSGQDQVTPAITTTTPLSSSSNNSKVAIPRLQQMSPKGSVSAQAKPKQQRKAQYKTIQPRLQPCDIPTYNTLAPAVTQQVTADLADTRSQLVQNEQENNVKDKITDNKCGDNVNDCEDDDDDFPLTRERLDSISNVEKDAMDEYLGTNNSQHEEELSKYFNANSVPEIAPDIDQTSKLSTLRQLLEQNGISEKRPATVSDPLVTVDSTMIIPETLPSFPSTISSLSQLPAHAAPFNQALQTIPALSNPSSSTRRRVSFENPISEEPVPPSPNTRSKNFNFTPISPGPHSPNGTQSKCSSTNASPFVSPRNTPVPRTKNSAHQNAGIMLSSDNRKHIVKIKKELDLTLEIPAEVHAKNYIAMSAPVSPMLAATNSKSMLQKLLNANSKVHYTPEYAAPQNLPQAADSTQFFPDLASRSQSVPLNQMQATGFPQNTTQIMPDIMKQDPDFNSIPDQNSENVKRLLSSLGNQPCDNNNIDTFNLDMSSNNHSLMEYGLNLINTCSDTDFGSYNQKLRNVTRSQSIDMDFDVNKCNPSRSVPSTPLPFSHKNLKINNTQLDPKIFHTSSRSYPSTPLNSTETFVYQLDSDCLINGAQIHAESAPEVIEFIPNFGINGENNQLESEFGIIENGDALMDENGILIQESFNGNIN